MWKSTALLSAMLLGSMPVAYSQPVTQQTTCENAMTNVNPRFLTNVMMLQIEAKLNGSFGSSVTGYADWLNRFVGRSPTGDAGVAAAEGVDRAMTGGPTMAEGPAVAYRARAEAASLLPALVNACDASPLSPVVVVMERVLSRAGYN